MYRLLSKSQVLYRQLEARGLRQLPLTTRRRVARAVEEEPGIDAVAVSHGSVVLIEVKTARKHMEGELRRLAHAQQAVVSDPEIMSGTPVYRGTRIPVHAIADMLAQGTTIEEILAGYPALTRERVELAPVYAKAFPRRGRPPLRPWSRRQPRRVTDLLSTDPRHRPNRADSRQRLPAPERGGPSTTATAPADRHRGTPPRKGNGGGDGVPTPP